MKIGIIGIVTGVSTAMALKNEYSLTLQIISISLFVEILTIVIFALTEIS